MKKCRHCGEPIEWDAYWTTWDHANRIMKLYAELCHPDLGFEGSKKAEPTPV
jgi:hypothetical protein